MSNVNFSNLPPEMLQYLLSWGDADLKDITSVSKDWQMAINQELSDLFKKYTQNESLKPYTILAEKTYSQQDPEKTVGVNIQRVKLIFQEIILKAQQKGYKKESLNLQTLSPTHLQEVIEWIEASDLNIFASQLANEIPDLEHVITSGDYISILDKAKVIREWMENNQDALKRIEKLKIENCNLSFLPKEIKYFTGLKVLKLDGNAIVQLPSEIQFLTQLKDLSVVNNKLIALPSEISLLTNLRLLHLNDNQITVLPSEIKSLTKLEELALNNNKLSALPNEIGSITTLKRLFLDNNQLSALPSNMSSLKNLERIFLKNNRLKDFPKEVSSFKKLEILDLSGNDIDFSLFPEKIGRLQRNTNRIYQ